MLLMVQLSLVYTSLIDSTIFCSHCSFAYTNRNVFGRNQKLNVSLERGQVDLIVRANYTDPWIQGDDKRTSRTIMIQVSSKGFIC
jgi:outer membrane protein assembly factor BamA